MLEHVITVLVALCLWRLLQKVLLVRRHLAVLKKIELHGDFKNYFSLDFVRKVQDLDSFYRAITPWIYSTGAQQFALWVPGMLTPTYVFVHPEKVKAVLELPASEPKGDVYPLIAAWLGDGLLLSSGKKWERHRQLVAPAFHCGVLRPYVGVYNSVVDTFLSNINEATSGGRSVDIFPLVSSAALDTMLRCALSYDDNVQQLGKPHPYLKAVNELSVLFDRRMANPFLFNDFIYYLTPSAKRFRHLCCFVHAFADEIIVSRRKMHETDPLYQKRKHPDFLDILLQSRDEEGNGLSDNDIRAEVNTFMFAGHNTTASATSWALHSLAKYPDEQDKVLEEVTSVLGDREIPDWNDLGQLQYLQCFIKESLRVHPLSAGGSRRLTKHTTIGDVELPAGSELQCLLNIMHSHPAVWGEPEVFRPSRFLPENMKDADPFQFIPFSAGTRNCIGQHLAMDEIKVFIARIVMRFKIELDPKKESVPFYTLNLVSKDGVHLRFIKRKRPKNGFRESKHPHES